VYVYVSKHELLEGGNGILGYGNNLSELVMLLKTFGEKMRNAWEIE
jgi:hypothetical protein